MKFKSKTLAQALWETLESAHPRDAVQASLEALDAFFEAYGKDALLRDFFNNPKVTPENKGKIAASFITFYKAPAEAERFLALLIRHNALDQLLFILPLLRLIAERHFKTASVHYKVAASLTESQKKDLAADLKEALTMDHVELHETVDPEVLGGISLRMEGELFDASLRTKMRKIQKALT